VPEPLWLYGATWPVGLAERLVSEVRALGLTAELWGLEPTAFGAEEETIATVLDVSPFLAAKLAALRMHRTQVGSEHLLSTMPDEVASKLLSREYFVRLQAPGESGDWLVEFSHLPTSEPLGGLYGR
jgi:LmbE family N-acetylglucosaminyl deacetylase